MPEHRTVELAGGASARISARPRTASWSVEELEGSGSAPAGTVLDALLAVARAEGAARVVHDGAMHWLIPGPAAPAPPHRRQCAPFSCGAAAALMALADDEPADEEASRAAELRLWQQATNHPSIEPYGLAVALRRAHPQLPLEIRLDVERPVMLEHLAADEAAWRQLLQLAFREDARALGIPAPRERLTIAELREALETGRQVLLLISLQEWMGVEVPHWVLCREALDGVILVEDPWVDEGADPAASHLLPIADADLDVLASLHDDGYRGAVIVG
ncbi:peptidase C39 family protein [Brachybacterium sp. DNPG3]